MRELSIFTLLILTLNTEFTQNTSPELILVNQFMTALQTDELIFDFLIAEYPAEDVRINSIQVERFTVKELSKDTFEVAIDGGNGVFCAIIKIIITREYDSGRPFILLAPLKEKKFLGSVIKYADPWFEYRNICD